MRPAALGPGGARHGGGLARAARKLGFVALLLLAGVTTFVLDVVLLLLLMPGTDERIVAIANRGLDGMFRGDLRINGVESIGLGGVRGARAVMRDADGKQVLEVVGLDVDVDVIDLARGLLGKGALEIELSRLELEHADVRLENDSSGVLGIARAFEPRTPSASETPSRELRLYLREVRIQHVWVHGNIEEFGLDADIDALRGSLSSEQSALRVEIAEGGLQARNLPGNLDLSGDLQGALSVPEHSPLALFVSFRGDARDIPLELAGELEGSRFAASAFLPHVEPRELQRVVAGVPIVKPASVGVRAWGEPSSFDVDARVDIAGGWARALAHVFTAPRPRVIATLDARRLDARAFVADAPALRASTHAQIDAASEKEGWQGSFETALYDATFDAERLPRTTLSGRFDSRGVEGRAVLEGSARGKVDFNVAPPAGDYARSRLDFDADLASSDLARVPFAPRGLGGSARLRANGIVDLGNSKLHARANVSAAKLSAGPTRMDELVARADLAGTLEAPTVDLEAGARNVVVLDRRLSQVDVKARGRVDRPHVELSIVDPFLPRVRGSADIFTNGATLISRIELEARRGEDEMRASVGEIRIAGGRTRVTDLDVQGVGTLSGSALLGKREQHIAVRASDVDLAKLSRIWGTTPKVRSGLFNLDADVEIEGKSVQGRVSGDLRELRFTNGPPLRARADFELAGRQLSGYALGELGKAGEVKLSTTRLSFPEGELDLAALMGADGEVVIDADLDLARVRALVPARLPISRAEGKLTLHALLRRHADERVPDLSIQLKTVKLELVGRTSDAEIRDKEQAKRQKPWIVKGIDLALDAKLVGHSGETHVKFRATDSVGTLLALEAEAELPVDELRSRRAVLPLLLDMPLEARLRVPRRELIKLPVPLRPSGVLGSVGFELSATGTANDPKLALVFEARKLRAKDPTVTTPIDVNAKVVHEDDVTRLEARVDRDGRTALEAKSELRASLRRVIEDPETAPFEASADVKFERFPLQTIPVLKERQVAGDLNGRIKLEHLGKDARLRVALATGKLNIAEFGCRSVQVELDAHGGRLLGKARLDHPGGYARAELDAGLVWGSALLPHMNHDDPVKASLKAKGFRAATLQPFVHETLSELDGKIDADVKLEKANSKSRIEGHAEFREGLFQLPSMGQRFRDVSADVRAAPDGVVRIERVSVRGVTGRARAAATLRLDGLRPTAARAKIRIDKREKLPVTVEGVEIGEAWGKVDVDMRVSRDQKTTLVGVSAPQLYVQLPELEKHDVQKLDDAEFVRVGAHVAPGEFRRLPLQLLAEPTEDDGSRVIVAVRLGNDVWLKQGKTVSVRLSGHTRIELAQGAAVTGQIRLGRGKLDVQGKLFELEQGTITFNNRDPANPTVVAAARWDSPEGYRVYAEYTGPVKTGKLKLRSEPSLSQDEILSLLLFGTTDGFAPDAGGGGGAATAATVAGGPATQGMNRALSDITDIDVSTRIDSSHGTPRPELVVQLTRRLAAKLAYKLGEPTFGEAPDRSFLTLDLRIRTRWSLATTFGDKGATIADLVWSTRY